jgi:hypothetical protein
MSASFQVDNYAFSVHSHGAVGGKTITLSKQAGGNFTLIALSWTP